MSTYEIRHLASEEDYFACYHLQAVIWGDDPLEAVAPRILKISQQVSGIAAGAFAPDGELVGFVWGLSGLRKGALGHWSHMCGVHPRLRDSGLGQRLKLFQRDTMLSLGIETVYWTFDPLEARNAHLNFNRLGVVVDEYVRDYYGAGVSPLHQGIGTDRFIVAWRLPSPHVVSALAGALPGATASFGRLEIVNSEMGEAGSPRPRVPTALPREGFRVEVPARIQEVKIERPDEGPRWRAATRRAFEGAFELGLEIRHFYRDPSSGRCFYIVLPRATRE